MTEETKNKMAEIIAKAKGTSAKPSASKAEIEENSKPAGLIPRDVASVKLPDGVELSDIYPVLKPSPEGNSPDFGVDEAKEDFKKLCNPPGSFNGFVKTGDEVNEAEMFMVFLDWQAIDAQSRVYQSPFNIYPISPAQTKFKTDQNWLKSVLDKVRTLSSISTTTEYFDGEGRITIAYRTLLKGRRSIIAEWSPDYVNKTELQATYVVLRDFVKLYLSGQVLK